jgi:bacterioferritin (cytochrome b1)
VDWIEAQLQNIQDVGLQNYLAKQMNPGGGEEEEEEE